MSEQTIAAGDLTVGDVVRAPAVRSTPQQVTAIRDEGGMVAVTFGDSAVPLLYDPDARLRVAAPDSAPPTPAPTDPRDAVITAARALVASWHVAYPSGTAMAAAIGLREGELDAALARLDAAQYDGHAEPEPTSATAADHWQPTGRPVSAPPAGDIRQDTLHIGRAFAGHEIEDRCPCPQAPCGLVEQGKADPSCSHHPTARARTMRQIHPAHRCTGGGAR